MLIYLWPFAFTSFFGRIPLYINELDMAGHVWCDECYLVDWLLLHDFIPHHSVRYKYHHPMQVKVHTLKYTFTLLKSYYNPIQNSWDAKAIATFEIMHFPTSSMVQCRRHEFASFSWQSTLLGEEGAAAEIGSYNQFIPRLLYWGK